MARDFLKNEPSALESIWLARAQQLYVEDGLEVRAIEKRLELEHARSKSSKKNPPSRGTLDRWRRDHDWKALRTAYSQTSLPIDAMLQELRVRILKSLHDLKNTDSKDYKNLADSLSTVNNMLDKVGAKKNLDSYLILFLKAWVPFFKTHDPELATRLAGYVDEFYLYVMERYAPEVREVRGE